MSGRQVNRMKRRQLVKLQDRMAVLQRELLDSDRQIESVDREMAEVTAGAHQTIERYVDSLAQVANLDDSRVEPGAAVLDKLVYWRWHGVETREQADEELLQEVALRSVNKTDLALLLSSIDHTAILLWANLPESLRGLHGDALVAAGMEKLTLEDFEQELVRDARWTEMRVRWIRMGWRGAATEGEFSRAFVRAVVERVALIQDGQGDDLVRGGLSLLHDTVIDEQLNKVRPEARAMMEKAFKERLDREFDQIQSRRGAAPVVNGSSKDEFMTTAKRILDPLTLDDRKSVLEEVAAELQPKPPPRVIYSDHALMRHGRELWEETYKDGNSDEEVRDALRAVSSEQWSDAVSMFAAKWAVHAFQRLMTSHTFAAALMCSDVQKEVLEGIERQWDGFLVLVPNGMLVAGGFEFTRVLVATYSYGAWLGLLAPDGVGFRLLDDEANDLPALLASDEADLAQDSPSQRCLILAKRLVAGLLLNLQDATTHKIRKVEARPKSRGREAEPEHRIVTIGTPLEIDCRDAVREYVERGTRSSEKTGRHNRGMPTVQWMVRGHYRMQAHGPQHALRRKQWIKPFWKGNEAALIQTRARVPS